MIYSLKQYINLFEFFLQNNFEEKTSSNKDFEEKTSSNRDKGELQKEYKKNNPEEYEKIKSSTKQWIATVKKSVEVSNTSKNKILWRDLSDLQKLSDDLWSHFTNSKLLKKDQLKFIKNLKKEWISEDINIHEAIDIYKNILQYIASQENISKPWINSIQRFIFIIDSSKYNLWKSNIWQAEEQELYWIIKEKELKNIFLNLWLDENFDENVKNNLYNARKIFREKLISKLRSWLSIEDLKTENWKSFNRRENKQIQDKNDDWENWKSSNYKKLDVSNTNIDNHNYDDIKGINKILWKDLKSLENLLSQLKEKEWDFSWFKEILRNNWIEERDISREESIIIYNSIVLYINIQRQISNKNSLEIFKLLIDINKDNKIWTNEKEFWVSEVQILYWLNKQEIENLFDNLWLDKNFIDYAKNNLYNARNIFRNILATKIWSGISIEELKVKDWAISHNKGEYEKDTDWSYKKFKQNLKWEISNKVEEIFNQKNITDENHKKTIIDTLSLKAIWISSIDNKIWLFTTVDIQNKYINAIVDSISFWCMKWAWCWIWLNKKLLEAEIKGLNRSLSLNFGTNLWLLPFISIWISESTSSTIFDASLNYNFMSWLWISIERTDINTSNWIENEISNKKEQLLLIYQDIKEWEKFETSSIKDSKDSNIEIYYNIFKNDFDNNTKGFDDYQKDKYIYTQVDSYIKQYKAFLYEKHWNWFTITWISFWLGNFLSFLWTGINAEYNSTETKRETTDIKKQQEITSKNTLTIQEIWWIIENYNWHKVISFKEDQIDMISIWSWYSKRVQIERENGKIYISNIDDSIILDTHTSKDNVKRILLIAWWNKDKNWNYVEANHNSYDNKISTDIELKKEKPVDIEALEREALSNTKTIRDNIFNLFDSNALTHKNTPWITRLQHNIHSYQTSWSPNLTNLWSNFLNTIKNNWYEKYAKSKSSERSLDIIISEIKNTKSEKEKIYILQALSLSLMKKEALKINNFEVDLWEQSLQNYDKKHYRDKYFDKSFESKFPNLVHSIQEARKIWYQHNWSSTNYTLKQVSDGSVWFTWVRLGGTKSIKEENTIMPYTWTYNIVEAKAWASKIKLDLAKDDALIDNLPKNYLKNILDSLQKNDRFKNIVKNIEDLKTFIKNGWNEQLKVWYDVFYCKHWECLNDDLQVNLKFESNWWEVILWNGKSIWSKKSSDSYITEANNLNLSITALISKEKEKTGRPDRRDPENPDPEPEDIITEPNIGRPLDEEIKNEVDWGDTDSDGR